MTDAREKMLEESIAARIQRLAARFTRPAPPALPTPPADAPAPPLHWSEEPEGNEEAEP